MPNLIDGILYSAQYLTIIHDQPSLAQDLIRSSGCSLKCFLDTQKSTEYETRKMNKVIREAFANNLGEQGK